ncbi:MAG: hypothetical protein HUJ95_04260 [Bacteroidales bacterium]|nr:hypothetical protein [Bacteroidales bacterium]
MTFEEFILKFEGEDTLRLVLSRSRYPEIDFDLAVNTIECRARLKNKVSEWYKVPSLEYPSKLSVEQCSSSATAHYKAALVRNIIGGCGCGASGVAGSCGVGAGDDCGADAGSGDGICYIADLTGGLGVDSWAFSKVASKVLYNEMNPVLAHSAEENFKKLGCDNIVVSCREVVPGGVETIIANALAPSKPSIATSAAIMASGAETSAANCASDSMGPCVDLIYMDPARRSNAGGKVFLLEDCQPNVLALVDEVLAFSRHFLIKLSPMADIAMVAERLGPRVREIHIVGDGGECKELLVWMDRQWSGEYKIVVCSQVAVPVRKSVATFADHETAALPHCSVSSDLPHHASSATLPPMGDFSFTYAEERLAQPAFVLGDDLKCDACRADVAEGADASEATSLYLFEPSKALLKSGAFNLISQRFALKKLGRSTHLYIGDARVLAHANHGKCFHVEAILPLNKAGLRECAAKYPEAEVTARNLPITSDELRKRLKVRPSDSIHIFACRIDSLRDNLLLICRKVK